MKHCFKKFMALLLATLMVMSAFSTIGAVAADTGCDHADEKWSVWTVNGVSTVAPTCDEPGYTWYRCECGEVEARNFVPKLGHDLKWTAKSVEDVACGELYAIYLGCTRCNYVEDWAPTTNVPGYKTHNYTSYEIVEYPTCLKYGELELVCANEDHAGADCPRISVIIQRLNGNKGEHVFDKLVDQALPTCDQDGWKLWECSLCYLETGVDKRGEAAETYLEEIKALGHDLLKDDTQEYNYVAADSCDVKCERCGYIETIHASLSNRKVTGTQPGALSCYTADYCTRCHYEGDKTAAHDASVTGHRVDTVGHNCYTVYTCKDCGYSWEEVATFDYGHSNLKIQEKIEPTCTTFGTIAWVCVDCGANGLEMIEIREHYMNPDKALELDGVVVLNADGTPVKADKRVVAGDCLTAGGIYITCGYKDCNAGASGGRYVEIQDPVAATGHHLVKVDEDPATCISPKKEYWECDNKNCPEDGTHYEEKEIGAPVPNAHPSTAYKVTTDPTCETQGVATLYCSLCSAEDKWVYYSDKDTKDEDGNLLHPNFDFSRLLAYEHVFTDAHATLLVVLNRGKAETDPGYLKVGDSAEYGDTSKDVIPTCTQPGKKYTYCHICEAKATADGVTYTGTVEDLEIDPTNHTAKVPYAGGYIDVKGEYGDQGLSYLRLPNGDHEALLWWYCDDCKTNWSEQGEKGHHTEWDAGLQENASAGIDYVEKVPATCGKDGKEAYWIIPCDKIFMEIKQVVAERVDLKNNAGEVIGFYYVFDKDNDGTLDGEIGAVNHDVNLTNYPLYTVDVDGLVVNDEGYNLHYLVPVKCHHTSIVYVEGTPDNDTLILDKNGNPITDGTIPALVHDWNEADKNVVEAYKKANYVAYKAPSCTNPGVMEHWVCTKCGIDKYGNTDTNGDGKLTDADFVIAALGHSMTDVAAKEPTCTERGWEAHKECSRCGAYWQNTKGETIAAKPWINSTGHTVPTVMTQDNYCAHNVKAPTCAEPGIGYGLLCSVCGECAGDQYHEVIPAVGHLDIIDLTADLNPNTCTDPTFTFKFCAICGHADTCAYADEAKFEEKVPACECDDDLSFADGKGSAAQAFGQGSFSLIPEVAQGLCAGDGQSAHAKHNISWITSLNINYYFTDKVVPSSSYTDKDYKAAVDFFKAGKISVQMLIDGKVVDTQVVEYKGVGGENISTLKFDVAEYAGKAVSFKAVCAEGVEEKNLYVIDMVYNYSFEVQSGCRVITDFTYWKEHKIQEGLKKPNLAFINDAEALAFFVKVLNDGRTVPADLTSEQGIADATAIVNDFFAACPAAYPCFGYIQYTGCTVCGYVVEGSATEIAGAGHVIDDHKNAETPVTTETLTCSVCALDVDAHENMYVITEKPSHVELAQGDKAATHHVVTHYALKACTACEYRGIVVTSVSEVAHSFTNGIIHTDIPASLTAPGVGHINCDQAGCPATQTVEIDQLSGTYLDLEIDNANKPGAGFTDSSIVAVTVKLSAADIAIWGINFKLTYDARYVEYLDGEEVWNSNDFKYGNSAVDVENTFADNHTGAKTNWVIVTAQAPNGADSKTQNIVVSGEQAFVTLYFKVNTPNAVVDDPTTTVNEGVVFGFQNVDIINNGFVQKVDEDGEPVFEADGVTPVYIPQKVVTTATGASIAVKKYMDHTGEGTVDLLDCLAAYQIYSGEILVEGDYSVAIDVNKDGQIDLVDFVNIYDYISGKISYEDIRNLTA